MSFVTVLTERYGPATPCYCTSDSDKAHSAREIRTIPFIFFNSLLARSWFVQSIFIAGEIYETSAILANSAIFSYETIYLHNCFRYGLVWHGLHLNYNSISNEIWLHIPYTDDDYIHFFLENDKWDWQLVFANESET